MTKTRKKEKTANWNDLSFGNVNLRLFYYYLSMFISVKLERGNSRDCSVYNLVASSSSVEGQTLAASSVTLLLLFIPAIRTVQSSFGAMINYLPQIWAQPITATSMAKRELNIFSPYRLQFLGPAPYFPSNYVETAHFESISPSGGCNQGSAIHPAPNVSHITRFVARSENNIICLMPPVAQTGCYFPHFSRKHFFFTFHVLLLLLRMPRLFLRPVVTFLTVIPYLLNNNPLWSVAGPE